MKIVHWTLVITW